MALIKITGIQMACVEDKKMNLKKTVQLVEMAAERGAKMVCLQELFHTIWFPKEVNSSYFQMAEKVDDEAISTMRELAKRVEALIIVPFFEESDGKYYNSAAILENDGTLAGVYRKVHVPQIPLYEEQSYFQGGDDFPVFDTSIGKVGIQICWDNFYPEGARILALKGAQIIMAPTAAAFASQERWKTVLSANAITNGLFVLRVNRVGDEEKHNFYGESFCVDPLGKMMGEPSGAKDGLFEVEVDLSLSEKIKHDYPYIKFRKPGSYSCLTEDSGKK